jgi:hypothetical protein
MQPNEHDMIMHTNIQYYNMLTPPKDKNSLQLLTHLSSPPLASKHKRQSKKPEGETRQWSDWSRRRPKVMLCAQYESAAVAKVDPAARVAALTAAAASLLPLKVV